MEETSPGPKYQTGASTIQSWFPPASNHTFVRTDQAPSTSNHSNGSLLNDRRDGYQSPFPRHFRNVAPVDFSDGLLDDFDLDTKGRFDTFLGPTFTSSNPTSLGSPSTQPSSNTFLQISEPPITDSYELLGVWPSTDLGYALGPSAHDNALTCDTSSRSAACIPSYDFPSSADVSVPIKGLPIATLTHQDHQGTTADICEQTHRSLRSSALSSPDGYLQEQHDNNVHDSHLHILPYKRTYGNVSQPQVLEQFSTPSTTHGPRSVASQNDFLQAELPESKSTNTNVIKLRRQRNLAAARKYRQKRLDRIEELEQALQKMQTERDELKVQVAHWKGKAEVLQSLMASSEGGGVGRRG